MPGPEVRVEVAPDDSRQMKLALEVFAAVGVLLISICVVYNVRQSRAPDDEPIAWQTIPAAPQAKPAPPESESPAAAAVPAAEKPTLAGRPAPRQLVAGGAVVSSGLDGRTSGGATLARTRCSRAQRAPVAQPRWFTRFAGCNVPAGDGFRFIVVQRRQRSCPAAATTGESCREKARRAHLSR